MIARLPMKVEPIPVLGPHIVVLLDDEPPALNALQRTLRSEPYELWTARNPSKVLRWVESNLVSLIIADQRMPEMEGTELLEKVRLRSPQTIGVILTAYPDSLRMNADLQKWVRSVISKPWNDGWLRGTLRHLIGSMRVDRPPAPEDLDGYDPDLGGEA